MRFTKMHGIGNDYVYVNCFEETVEDPAVLAPVVSDRHRGIGADGLILICPSAIADVRMRMFNADGSEARMCGNGIRCVAKYTYEHNLAEPGGQFRVPGRVTFDSSLRIETGNGILTVGLDIDDRNKVKSVCVNMGQPILRADEIPVAMDAETVIDKTIEVDSGRFVMTCVSMGNPHAVFFRENLSEIDLARLGPAIENHRLFPERVNVHFVRVDGLNEFTMLTWERGSGITLACGTGACACCVAAVLTGRCERAVAAHLPGGDLSLNWCRNDNCVYMTGPAEEVFTGVWG
ncbi:MAG: diaminopimelate epimerase [Planctomycetota bacterium]